MRHELPEDGVQRQELPEDGVQDKERTVLDPLSSIPSPFADRRRGRAMMEDEEEEPSGRPELPL
jgi:hypothetical protein